MLQDKLARIRSGLTEGLDEFATLVEMHDSSVAVAVGNEDVSGCGDSHIGRHVEMLVVGPLFAFDAERHQQSPFGCVFLYDVQPEIGDPDIPFVIDTQMMWV